jgi:hypothetical protein
MGPHLPHPPVESLVDANDQSSQAQRDQGLHEGTHEAKSSRDRWFGTHGLVKINRCQR